jgi:hypothetical protein
MLKSRFSALITLLLVFLSGVLVGGLAYRLYNVSVVTVAPSNAKKPDPEDARRHIVADMRDHLKLDARIKSTSCSRSSIRRGTSSTRFTTR